MNFIYKYLSCNYLFFLQKLKEKAAFKNPDEFYFKMINTKLVNGVHKPE